MRLIDADTLIKKAYDEAKGMAEPYDDFGTLVEWLVDKAHTIEPDTDTISRQKVISTINVLRTRCDTDDIDDYHDLLVEAIEVLPPSPSRPSVTDTDTVSRQAVLDAILQKPAWHNSDGSFYHSDDIRDAVNAVPPSLNIPPWIPCSVRMPEVTVLCCDTRGEMIIGYPYQDEESNTGYSAVLDDVVMIDCTAWMPLPEPYRP